MSDEPFVPAAPIELFQIPPEELARVEAEHRGGYLLAASVRSLRNQSDILKTVSAALALGGHTDALQIVERCRLKGLASAKVITDMLLQSTDATRLGF